LLPAVEHTGASDVFSCDHTVHAIHAYGGAVKVTSRWVLKENSVL